jgi:hypothetical protein
MKTKFLVCEINQNKMLGGTSYSSLDDAISAFSGLVSDYGVEPYEEMIEEKTFESDDGFTVQIVEILSE